MKRFFRTLPLNFIRSFSGPFLLWHFAAIVLTYVLVTSGFDWNYFLFMQKGGLLTFFFPAIVLGGLLAILLPVTLLLIGKIGKDAKAAFLGSALGQAALLGWFVSAIFKAFTGRIQPNMADLVTDISHQFQFGFWKHGIFWGWPSSHTTVSFAMAVALVTLFPKNRIVRYAALAYAFYVAIGVSFTIHWFSDAVAGAIIGSVVGIVVGKSFRKR